MTAPGADDARPDVSVVVVTYNSPDWTRRCLEALFGAGRPAASFEVVVLDSGSDEPTRALLREWSDRARVLLSAENVGFGRGCNLAVQHTRGRYVLLLNPDAVVDPGCVDALLAFTRAHPGAGLVGGRTLRPDRTTDPSSCWGRPTLWSTFCFATGASTAFSRNRFLDPESLGRWDRDSVREVDVVTGCLLMASRETWDRLGGFDERFFMYGEDADLSLRARALGLRPAITPDAVAVHAVGASSSRRVDKTLLLLRGKATLARKHRTPAGARAALALMTAGVALRALGERARPGGEPVWGRVWAERATWRAGFGPRAAASEVLEDLGRSPV